MWWHQPSKERKIAYSVLAVLVFFSLAGCSSSIVSSPAATVPSSASQSPAPLRTVAVPASTAAAHAKVLAYALAGTSASVMLKALSSVSGPVMDAYVRHEALVDEAYAEAGQDQPESASKIPDGYQLCYSGTCQSLTGFRSDASGRITDFFSEGALAVGAGSTGSGLEISDVSLLAAPAAGIMFVTFEAHDMSWTPVNTDPPFLPVFVASDGSRFQYEVQDSLMPSSLQPGQSAAVDIAFDTADTSGQFSLTENDSLPGNTIVGTTLHAIMGSLLLPALRDYLVPFYRAALPLSFGTLPLVALSARRPHADQQRTGKLANGA